jgi:hypothetical protein
MPAISRSLAHAAARQDGRSLALSHRVRPSHRDERVAARTSHALFQTEKGYRDSGARPHGRASRKDRVPFGAMNAFEIWRFTR